MNLKLKKSVVKLMNNEKVAWFAGNILNKEFIKKDDLEMPTMATDGVNIFYSEEWIEKCTNEEIQFCIVHEFFHIIFKHCHYVADLKLHPMISNIAQDIVINSILQEDGIGSAPEGIIKGNHYGEVEIEVSGVKFSFKDAHKKSFLEIYKEIMSKIPTPPPPPKGGEGDGDGKGKGKQGQGNEPSVKQNGQDVKTLDKTINKKLSQEQQDDVDGEVQQINASAKMKGIGGGLARALDALTKGVVPWKNYIRPVVDRATAGFPTYSRPRRRSPPTNVITPSIKRVGVNVTVAIDTSGSISDDVLKYFLGEIDNMLSSYPTGSVTVNALYHTDKVYSIQKNAKYIKEVVSKIESGGTCHHDVFDKSEELDSKILICLTDGYSSYPDTTTIRDVIFVCIEKDGRVPDFARRIDVDMATIIGGQ